MINEKFLRHHDIIGGDLLSSPILIVGAGAIGSWVTMTLTRLGFNRVTVVDMDSVSQVNLGAQFYSDRQASEMWSKVQALKMNCAAFNGVSVGTREGTVQRAHAEDDLFSDKIIVISAVDSMETRKWLFDHVTRFYGNVTHFIDSRMGAEYGVIFNLNTDSTLHKKDYAKSLFTDAEAEELPCMAKATAYCALTMAGLVVNCVVRNLTQGDFKYHTKIDLKQGVVTAY